MPHTGRYRDGPPERTGAPSPTRARAGHHGRVTWRPRWASGRAPIRPNDARRELARLLTVDDLGGFGWRAHEERAWETGRSGDEAEWAERARDAGLLTVWRSFDQAASHRQLWVQASRLCSEDDAAEALGAVPDRMLRNLRAQVDVVGERAVAPPKLEGVDGAWAREQRTEGRRGTGVARYLAFRTGATVVIVAATGLGAAWTWDDVQQVAQLQADRLR